jgi:hypothetical protein
MVGGVATVLTLASRLETHPARLTRHQAADSGGTPSTEQATFNRLRRT